MDNVFLFANSKYCTKLNHYWLTPHDTVIFILLCLCPVETVHEPLPLAPPPPPRELSEIETNKMKKQREAVLRELRVFLRETTNRLLAERKYKEFTKPVNQEEVGVALVVTMVI